MILLSELRVTQFIKINQGYFFKNKLTIYTRSCSINRINTKNQKRLDFILKLHNEGYSNVEITNFLKLFGFKRRNKKDDYKVNDVWVKFLSYVKNQSSAPACITSRIFKYS